MHSGRADFGIVIGVADALDAEILVPAGWFRARPTSCCQTHHGRQRILAGRDAVPCGLKRL
ncbi:MAG: hypothetical protein B7Z80_10265 [Rhodospirillales bacterium 20-64-7]|nr:MAG: hypothetical protein B7Z80_10265 [Rhodospirillales bacterium 20-64-7]